MAVFPPNTKFAGFSRDSVAANAARNCFCKELLPSYARWRNLSRLNSKHSPHQFCPACHKICSLASLRSQTDLRTELNRPHWVGHYRKSVLRRRDGHGMHGLSVRFRVAALHDRRATIPNWLMVGKKHTNPTPPITNRLLRQSVNKNSGINDYGQKAGKFHHDCQYWLRPG